MANNNPIGIFDSGFGGISVLKIAAAMLKNENFIYFGDNLYAPYGLKPAEEITERALFCADFLQKKGCKAIVVACNTATSAAINKTREMCKIPVVSIEPAIKPALEASNGGKIIMLATPATCELSRYKELKRRLDTKNQIIDIGGYGIVERLESGRLHSGDYQDLLEDLLGEFKNQHIDSIVLGCTHYPFIINEIRAFASRHFIGECRIFHGGNGTAQQLARVLEANEICSEGPGGDIRFYTSADAQQILPIFHKLMTITVDN